MARRRPSAGGCGARVRRVSHTAAAAAASKEWGGGVCGLHRRCLAAWSEVGSSHMAAAAATTTHRCCVPLFHGRSCAALRAADGVVCDWPGARPVISPRSCTCNWLWKSGVQCRAVGGGRRQAQPDNAAQIKPCAGRKGTPVNEQLTV